jgi:hypothetical protein
LSKNVKKKKLSKSVKKSQKVVKKCKKVVKKLSNIFQKFRHTWKKPNKNNGAIVEKVRWYNSKKVKDKNKKSE